MNYLIAFIIGAVLWRIGGAGYKYIRRFILPLAITINAFIKRRKWITLLLFPVLALVFSLGYGEKHPYWRKFAVGIAWIIPRFIFLGFNWFVWLIPVLWIALFWLSNHKPYSNIFKWHWVELIIGGSIGMAYC